MILNYDPGGEFRLYLGSVCYTFNVFLAVLCFVLQFLNKGLLIFISCDINLAMFGFKTKFCLKAGPSPKPFF